MRFNKIDEYLDTISIKQEKICGLNQQFISIDNKLNISFIVNINEVNQRVTSYKLIPVYEYTCIQNKRKREF